MAETDPKKLADRLEREADEMERGSDELERRTQETAQEWERKRADPGVPGAPPPAGEEEAGDDETSAASDMGPPAKSDPDRDAADPDGDSDG